MLASRSRPCRAMVLHLVSSTTPCRADLLTRSGKRWRRPRRACHRASRGSTLAVIRRVRSKYWRRRRSPRPGAGGGVERPPTFTLGTRATPCGSGERGAGMDRARERDQPRLRPGVDPPTVLDGNANTTTMSAYWENVGAVDLDGITADSSSTDWWWNLLPSDFGGISGWIGIPRAIPGARRASRSRIFLDTNAEIDEIDETNNAYQETVRVVASR